MRPIENVNCCAVPPTASSEKAILSPAAIAVVVKSPSAVLVTAPPVEIDTPEVDIVLATVGAVDPVATFHVLIVAVSFGEMTNVHEVIVQAIGGCPRYPTRPGDRTAPPA